MSNRWRCSRVCMCFYSQRNKPSQTSFFGILLEIYSSYRSSSRSSSRYFFVFLIVIFLVVLLILLLVCLLVLLLVFLLVLFLVLLLYFLPYAIIAPKDLYFSSCTLFPFFGDCAIALILSEDPGLYLNVPLPFYIILSGYYL